MTELGAHYLSDVRSRFASLKRLADAALKQAEADFFTALGPEDNSLAVLVKHLSGNMVSRWGDLSGDGENATRDRDAEFIVAEAEGREELMAAWEAGWGTLFAALDTLDAERLLSTVTIRGEAHTLLEAIDRQMSHYALHVGQIVFLAKHFRGEAWETLSVPRGGSAAFNQRMWAANDKKNNGAA